MGLETGTYVNDLVITNPDGAVDPKSAGDDHLRLIKTVLKNTFPGMAGTSWRWQTKSSGYTVAATDNISIIKCTADLTLALTAAATIGNGFVALVWPSAAGVDVTIDPNGSETIAGAATAVVSYPFVGVIFSDGSNWGMFTVNGSLNVALPGPLSPAQLTADQTDYSPAGLSGATVLRIATDATARTINSIAGGFDGRLLVIHHISGAGNLILADEGAGTAANKISLSTPAVLAVDDSIMLQYDGTSSRWRVVGTIPVINPAFSVNKGGSPQAISDSTPTKVTWSGTEVFDTNGNFASDAFTPTVAGKYLFSFGWTFSTAVDATVHIGSIFKNGSAAHSVQKGTSGTGAQGDMVTAILDMNGTTDFVEFFVTHAMGGPVNLDGGTTLTWATGMRIG